MKYPFIPEYCTAKAGAEEDYKEEWGAFRYLLAGKMFALMGTDANDNPIISVKLNPEYGAELQERYQEITPGYYLNKKHWSSIRLDGGISPKLMKELLDESYTLVFQSLTKKLQKEILGG